MKMGTGTLIDKYGRQLTYLRVSVTDRCNFRCYYCMPEEGVKFADRSHLLTIDELCFLTSIFSSLGIEKIRITGGEPFVRTGLSDYLEFLHEQLVEVSVTTNGTLSDRQLVDLLRTGIKQVNVSLDTLDPRRFFAITRRDEFEKVYKLIDRLLEEDIAVKINCVVSGRRNVDDIIPFIEMTREKHLAVRFLEEMPFNGSDNFQVPEWSYTKIYSYIQSNYSNIIKLTDKVGSTSVNYKIDGYKGSFGIIPSFSRTFCGTCNRIRLSATGDLRTCLYGPAVTNLRDILRSGGSKDELSQTIVAAVAMRARDGFEAEALDAKAAKESMSLIGG